MKVFLYFALILTLIPIFFMFVVAVRSKSAEPHATAKYGELTDQEKDFYARQKLVDGLIALFFSSQSALINSMVVRNCKFKHKS